MIETANIAADCITNRLSVFEVMQNEMASNDILTKPDATETEIVDFLNKKTT